CFGRKYGFVRFLDIQDESDMVRRIYGIWIGAHQLRVNISRRLDRTEKGPTGAHSKHSTSYKRYKLSYAEAVRENTRETLPQQDKKQTEFKERQRSSSRVPDILVTPREEELAWPKDYLVGECFSLE
ncbi:hypothetical protein Ancab_004551, partial [Ancistrocladus abbreviatus]